jgi:hypothetical protein
METFILAVALLAYGALYVDYAKQRRELLEQKRELQWYRDGECIGPVE